jgi:hypothetical protein
MIAGQSFMAAVAGLMQMFCHISSSQSAIQILIMSNQVRNCEFFLLSVR